MSSLSKQQRTPKRGQGVVVVTPISADVTATPNSVANKAAEGAAAAKSMMDKCIVDSTTKGYTANVEKMKKWFKNNPMKDEHGQPVLLFSEDDTLKLPIPTHAVLAFFGHLGDIKIDASGNETTEGEVLKAASTMGGFRSALVWYYRKNGKKISEDLDTSLSAYMSGYKRTIAALKLRGTMSIHEGKRALEYEGYVVVAEHFMKLKPTSSSDEPKKKVGAWSQQLFAWPFFVLCWNMMARSVTVGKIMHQHISWSGDAMTINVPGHKGDQEGTKDYPRHVYANPLNPAVCPVLAVAVMLFSTAFRTGDNSQQLFEGAHSESRFSAVLRSVIDNLSPIEEGMLGGKKKDMGTHSPRKGSPTRALAMIDGPNPVQVFLRAGWSLGNVPDRYLFAGKGGDQLVGRTVCGLPMTDERFGTLPPHFTKELLESITQEEWKILLPNYDTYPSSIRCALPFLLASVVYHNTWLRTNLDSRHPIFHSRLYTSGLFRRFEGKALLGCVECPVTGLCATGVPSHIMLSKSIRDLSARMDAFESGHKRRHDEILHAFTDLKETLPKQLRMDLLNNFQIEGALPLTQDDLKQSLEAIVLRIEDTIDRRITASRAPEPSPNATAAASSSSAFRLWPWGQGEQQKYHMVPEGWRMPECSVKSLWDLWHFGHHNDQIRPLKHLKTGDFVVKTDACELSKARRVIGELHKIGVENSVIDVTNAVKADVSVSRLNLADSDAVFQSVYDVLAAKLFESVEKHRIGELRFNYVYNLILAHRKKVVSS